MEAHGTQMASLVLRSPALAGLAPSDVPRLLAYRVVAPEAVGGRVRPLARTDRVLAALEDAVDPNGDGDTADAAQVILLGLAGSFDGGGESPLADALASADRVGATVVAPAGNDGPTFSRPGSVGEPAAAPTVIAVGGESAARGPRTADLDARLGPAAARLGPLPLMGPDPAAGALPVTVLRDDAGVASGAASGDFLDPAGHSRVAGALVVVARSDATIAQVAARASAAGAAGLAIWDEDGGGAFPAVPGDSGLPLPVVGLGTRQGAALVGLVGREPGLTAALSARPIAAASPAVASFSSWGPTPDGRQKPDLVAPAVDREAAWPGRAPDGAAREAPLTGTSAAAADVAALALRLRIDRPELGPRAVASLLVQSAEPLPGVAVARQGAGEAALPGPAAGAMRVEPAIVSPRAGRAAVTLHDLVGRTGRYRISLRRAGAVTPLGRPIVVRAGAAARRVLILPPGAGSLAIQDARTGETVALAPVVPARPAVTPADALGTPRVTVGSGMPEVRVRLGLLRRADGRLRSARLHSVRLELLPQAGGDPLPVAGAKQDAPWPAGTYRFLVARRLASGLTVPAGAYRLRVVARGADGRALQRLSAPFTLS
jgi:subtilase family protein/PA domain-containing protein